MEAGIGVSQTLPDICPRQGSAPEVTRHQGHVESCSLQLMIRRISDSDVTLPHRNRLEIQCLGLSGSRWMTVTSGEVGPPAAVLPPDTWVCLIASRMVEMARELEVKERI